MVKAAYGSGKPAYGVGAGNATMVIDETADIDEAARNTRDQQDQRSRLGLFGRRQPAGRRLHLRRVSDQLQRRGRVSRQRRRRSSGCSARTGTSKAAARPTPSPGRPRWSPRRPASPSRRQDVLDRRRNPHRQAASVLDREARASCSAVFKCERLRRRAGQGAADLRDRRPRPLLRHLLVRRRPHPSPRADGAGQPDHGAPGAIPFECGHVHQRHADDVEHGLRRLGRQHHQRERLASSTT